MKQFSHIGGSIAAPHMSDVAGSLEPRPPVFIRSAAYFDPSTPGGMQPTVWNAGSTDVRAHVEAWSWPLSLRPTSVGWDGTKPRGKTSA